MRDFTPQEILTLRDSQLNAFVSLAVYVSVSLILQLLLFLAGVDMPPAQFFDSHGNFSTPGIIIGLLFFASAFLPHAILLRRYGLSWREAARVVRDFTEGLHEGPAIERRTAATPIASVTDEERYAADAYWAQRWQEFLTHREDDPDART